MLIVIFDERDARREVWIARELEHSLDQLRPGNIGRMSFSGENNLHRLQGIGQNQLQAIQIMKDQIRALVAGEPARKTDR